MSRNEHSALVDRMLRAEMRLGLAYRRVQKELRFRRNLWLLAIVMWSLSFLEHYWEGLTAFDVILHTILLVVAVQAAREAQRSINQVEAMCEDLSSSTASGSEDRPPSGQGG